MGVRISLKLFMSITLVTEVKLTSSETLQFDNNDTEVTGKSIT